MESLLARLERRFGRFAIPNLILFVIAGTALVWVLSLQHPETQVRLMLYWDAVRRGQVWRLVTFLFVPPSLSTFSLFLNLYFMWWVGTSLEQHWGAFKFNVYYFTGVLGAIAAAFVTGQASNIWLNDASLLVAFATLFPNVEILLFFVLPIKVKWLGILSVVPMAIFFAIGGWATRASILASLAGYVLFFSEHWWDVWKRRGVVVRQKARRQELESDVPVLGQRVCAICGAREADGTDIRVCSCEKCGGKPRDLCLSHSRNHGPA
jgi:membrane associated rhomboid family serine protease